MKDYKFNVEKDLTINRYRLAEECVSHPGIYYRYADALAEANDEVSNAKDNLQIILGERLLAIRERCSENGKKPTEATIKAMLDTDDDVIEARNKLREVEGISARLNAMVKAMEARRAELDNLTKLAVSNYFAIVEAKTSEDMSDDGIQRDIRKSMNQKD